eukprot:SAG31_NODE_32992_length_349_cov_0.820000_1_plen_49_part_10
MTMLLSLKYRVPAASVRATARARRAPPCGFDIVIAGTELSRSAVHEHSI